jgi:hypothetical protein
LLSTRHDDALTERVHVRARITLQLHDPTFGQRAFEYRGDLRVLFMSSDEGDLHGLAVKSMSLSAEGQTASRGALVKVHEAALLIARRPLVFNRGDQRDEVGHMG